MERSFLFSHTTENDVKTVIEKLRTNAAIGYDSISIKFIKNFSSIFIPVLTKLINEAIQAGSFPNAMKIAKVLPIFKNGNKKSINNYRPISILTHISKIYENILLKDMTKYVKNKNIINPNQFGFTEKSQMQQ